MSCLFLRNCTLIVYLCDEINASRIVKHIAQIAAYFWSDRKDRKGRSGSSFTLSFDLRSSNYIDGISFYEMFLSPPFTQLEYSILPERPRFFDKKLVNIIFLSTKQIKMNFRRAAFNKHNYSLENQRAYLKTPLVTFLSAWKQFLSFCSIV